MADIQCPLPANTECITYLTYGQALGLLIAAEVGFASALAALYLFGKIARNALRNFRQAPAKDWRFFKSPLDVYMLSLLLSDLIHALGGILNLKWVAQGTVSCGASCTAQGVIKQIGATGVSLATLAIAVHTFYIIVFRRGSSRKAITFAAIIVCAIWLYLIIFVAATLALKGDEFYTPTPYWCWVGSHFTSERILGEYFWIWFTALVSLGLYVPLFFFLRGNIKVDEKRWNVQFRRRPRVTTNRSTRSHDALHEDTSQMSQNPARVALIMLLYPVCYVAIILPLSIGRWVSFSMEAGHSQDSGEAPKTIPSAAILAVISIFELSGLVNVILLIWTRPGLLLLSDFPKAPSLSESRMIPTDDVRQRTSE